MRRWRFLAGITGRGSRAHSTAGTSRGSTGAGRGSSTHTASVRGSKVRVYKELQ